MKTIKAILIDSRKREISVVEIKDDLKDYYAAIQCDCITSGLRFNNNDCIFVDDEGLIKGKVEHAFTFNDKFFAGNGLVVGGTRGGASCDAKTDIEEIKRAVKFAPEGWILPEEDQDKLTRMVVVFPDEI
jgi:hypothetical protein